MNCLNSGNHGHHIIPISKGGKDQEDNIILLCFDCHKKAKLYSHFRDFQVMLLTRKYYFENRVLMEGFSWVNPSFKNTIYKKEFTPYEKTTFYNEPTLWINEGRGARCSYCRFKIFDIENHRHTKKLGCW